MISTKRWTAVVLIPGLVLLMGASAMAEGEEFQAFKADFDALKSAKEKDVNALARLCQRGAKLYANLDDEKDQKVILDLVGRKIPGLTKDENVTQASLEALGKIRDPDGARYIRPHLKLKNKKDASETLKLAIKTAGMVPHKSLAAPLISIFKRSDSINVKRISAKAMCEFGRVKGYRSKILDLLLTTVRQLKPGTSGRMAQGNMGESLPGKRGETSPVWTALSPILTGLLNKLTGQDVRTLGNWFGIYDNNKRNLDALFTHEEDE